MSKPMTLEDIITLNYGRSLPEHSRTPGKFNVFGSGGCVGTHQQALVNGPGIIVGRKGNIGSVIWSEDDFFPIDTTYYVSVKDASISLRFVYYLLKSLPLSKMNTDAAVPGLNRNNANRVKINLPDKQIRDKISDVLSKYDDLIENSRRRIALLEEAARLLYREWFVSSERKTNTKPLKEIANLTMGQSPASKFYNKIGEGLPFHQGVTGYGTRFVEDTVFSTKATKLAYPHDILLSVRAPVGRINITKNKIVLGRGLAALSSKTGSNSFLFYALKSFFFKEDIIGTGSIYAATTKEQLEKIHIADPPKEQVDQFEALASPIDRQISNLDQQIQNLTKAQDLLLPRLMDGRITI